MINLFRKSGHKQRIAKRKAPGAATLVTAIVLLVMSTLIIIFAANYARTQTKISANLNRNTQAFEAAEAGLEYGINYLQTNSATILAGPVGGFIPNYTSSSTTNVVLPNNSRFSITYTNPVANNYELIRITSVGTSDDGTATRTVVQDVQFGSLLLNPPTGPLVSKGSVTMSGNATVTNTSGSSTIQTASSLTMGGSSQTVLSSGVSSTPGNIRSDVTQNSSTLANQSQSDFFATYFGVPSATVESSVKNSYSNTSSFNYSSTLNGKTGTSIWINQTDGTATINGNTTIGSAAAPVLLIVNGRLSLSGNVTIYGFVFVLGENDIATFTGNTQIIGGIATTETFSMTGNIGINYDPTVLDNLQNSASMRYYAKVAGSWRDF